MLNSLVAMFDLQKLPQTKEQLTILMNNRGRFNITKFLGTFFQLKKNYKCDKNSRVRLSLNRILSHLQSFGSSVGEV